MPVDEIRNESSQRGVHVTRVGDGRGQGTTADVVAVEEPLEIRIRHAGHAVPEHQAVSITMRTPGHDFELAAGFLYTEGILSRREQVAGIEHCGHGPSVTNTVSVDLAAGVEVDLERLARNFYTTSSCGVCGKRSLEALATGAQPVQAPATFQVDASVVHSLPARLRERQLTFDHTGGLHAAAFFSRTGELLGLREDVGRHNAVDKLVGSWFLAGALPARECILFLSGRASFELLQKAVMAGVPVVCAVGAPSSLAVDAATEFGVTLCGFVRDNRFNIYSGAGRVCGW